MSYTLHFKLKFHKFPHFKWVFIQHNNCSLHQYLSNHYSHDHVWIWKVAFSKKGIFWCIYGNLIQTSCITQLHHICTSKTNMLMLSLPNRLDLGPQCACTCPCTEALFIHAHEIFMHCLCQLLYIELFSLTLPQPNGARNATQLKP
jgi:hypothetical protein